MFAVRTLVHRAVESLVHRLVLRLVANTGLPAPGLALGLGAPADEPPEAPGVRLLVRPVVALPVNRAAEIRHQLAMRTVTRHCAGYKAS